MRALVAQSWPSAAKSLKARAFCIMTCFMKLMMVSVCVALLGGINVASSGTPSGRVAILKLLGDWKVGMAGTQFCGNYVPVCCNRSGSENSRKPGLAQGSFGLGRRWFLFRRHEHPADAAPKLQRPALVADRDRI